MTRTIARINLDDVVKAKDVAMAINSWAQGTDDTSACSGAAAAVVALSQGSRVYIDTDDGRSCEMVFTDASNEDALMDIGGSYYTISEWSENSVVCLKLPTINDALDHPYFVRAMSDAVMSTHHAASNVDGWVELIEELDEIEGAASTLRGYGDMYTGNCLADAAHAWLDAGIEDDGSIGSWCEIGCWDAATAAEWIAAGLSPDDVEAAAKRMRDQLTDDQMSSRYHGGVVYACCNGDIPYQDLIIMHRQIQAE